ncbi:putative transcription factor bZIP family [Helianthus annuus]|nr:putative transcription factor bZIP family [Helianthus annuus]
MVGLGVPGVVAVTVGSPAVSSDGMGKNNGDMSSVSPSSYEFTGIVRGRRSGTVEKVVERRQRRMIKNRESAARSRARKQNEHTLWNWKLKWLTQVNRIRFGRQRVRRGITMNTRTNQNSCRLMLIFICGNEMQEL